MKSRERAQLDRSARSFGLARAAQRARICGLAGLLAACAAGSSGSLGAQTIPIDDSYTVSGRYEQNRAEHPEFRLPTLTMVEGQRIQFDRLYRSIGKRELHLDVFQPPPDQGRGQAIVLIHGGGWRAGNKSNFYPIANLLAQRGYTVFLPEFRLAPEAGYPAGLVDIVDALEWVKSHADEFAVEPDRIAIGGESAGGQMAAVIAYTGGTDTFSEGGLASPSVNALIDIDGVLDMTDPLALQYENRPGSVASAWLGGQAEQVPDRWKTASAASHVGPQSPPTLVISGKDPRFTAGIEKVSRVLDQHAIRHRHVPFPGLPHTFWLFEPYATQVVDAIDTFLREED